MASLLKGSSEALPDGDARLTVVVRSSFSGNADHHHERKELKSLEREFSGAGESAALLRSTISEWYDAKHRSPSKEEIAFVNSLPVGGVPALRIRVLRQRRVPEEDRGSRLPVRIVRKEVRPADRDHIRFQEDTDIRMDRIPHPPIRAPFGQNVGGGRQKRRFHRVLLA